ncbi:hypothetical protein GCM10011586_02400 [Silvibacterium dinghuense]|nr:hypothetical protein GCM10011586_02400 [Silvibacterium dinghuense]
MRPLLAQLRSRRSWLALLGVFCIALVLAAAVVQVTHSHTSGQPDHDCSLCISAHHVIQVATSVRLNVTSLPVGTLTTEARSVLPVRRFFVQLASRPPPADQLPA